MSLGILCDTVSESAVVIDCRLVMTPNFLLTGLSCSQQVFSMFLTPAGLPLLTTEERGIAIDRSIDRQTDNKIGRASCRERV